MAVDNSNGNSEQSGTEDPEKKLSFADKVLRQVQQTGMGVVEGSRCPHCQGVNIHVHPFCETLHCMYENCQKVYPSRVPRPPIAGDVLAHHYQQALGVLQTAAESLTTHSGLMPLKLEELGTLPQEIQVLVVRQWMTCNLELYGRVHKLAAELAERGV